MIRKFRLFARGALVLFALLFISPVQAVFIDNSDGTVTDTTTSLMWDQCSWGQSGTNCSTGTANSVATHTWVQALGAAVTANAMNSGMGYKNHTDWRLPNKNELESLVDIFGVGGAINTTVFPNTGEKYWSSTTYAKYPIYAWSVEFYRGWVTQNLKANGNYISIRLVRGGQSFSSFDSQTGSSTACVAPPAGMDHWYPLSENTGTTTSDIIGASNGNAQPGAIGGTGPVPVSGMVGSALSFNGSSQYVEVPDSPGLSYGNPTDNFSIDAWIKVNPADKSGVRPIVDKRMDQGGRVSGYEFYLYNGMPGFQLADGAATNNSCGPATSNTTSCTNYGSTADVADGQFHLVAATIQKTGATPQITLYVDGAVVYTGTVRLNAVNTAALLIGRGYPIAAVNPYYFKGAIDELEIFNRALTQAEIQSIYNVGSAGKCIMYLVTPVVDANGSIDPSTPQQVNSGSQKLFSLLQIAHRHISSVTGCGGTLSGNTYTTGPITGNCTVTASFAIDTYALGVTMGGAGTGLVTSAPAGISCSSGTCATNYDYNTSVTLAAVADAGYTFMGWSGGGCSGTGTCTVTMTAAKSVTATFADTMPPIVTASPAGGTIGAQTNVTLSANEPATIYCTADGSTPTTSSPICSGPISVFSCGATIKYLAVDTAGNETVGSQTYTNNDPSFIHVTDPDDAHTGISNCASNGGTCTLRAAIIQANTHAGDDTICLPAGTYTNTLAGVDAIAAVGDLDITASGSLTINGAGAATTIIDGGTLDRVFEIHPGATAFINAVTVRNGKINYNGEGAGIFNWGTMTLNQAVITGNYGGSFGGGIFNIGPGYGPHAVATATLIDTTVSNNTINIAHNRSGGGAGIWNGGVMTLTRVTVSGNTDVAPGRGGGIVNSTGPLTITNSTISGNTALNGGGIFNYGTIDIVNTTFSDNVAVDTNNVYSDGIGGGIWNYYGPVTLKNTIFNNNTAMAGRMISPSGNCAGAITSLGHNLSSDTTCVSNGGTDRNSTDPLLGILANNNGPTKTHALLSGSPATNAVPLAFCTASTDQRGIARPQGTACDIGAYEATQNNNALPIAISTGTLPGGAVGAAYSQTLAATGGTAPYTWSSGSLPAGLSLNASTGVISGTPTTVGLTSFSVSVTDAASAVVSKTFSTNVGKGIQTITFGAAPTVVVGSTGTATATATSSLAVSFTSSTPSVCTVSGSTVTGVTTGTCTIVANQAGNANYNAAAQVSQSITIKASQTVSFGAAPTIVVGGTGTVLATATSGLAVSFSSMTPSVCAVSGSTVTGVTAGACTIAANQAGNASYNAATQVAQSITVAAKTIDLTVSALSSTAEGGSVNAGGSVTLNSTVTNTGNTTTTKSNIPMYFYLSKDKVITAADTLLGSRTVPGLAAGAGSGAATTLTIPLTLAPGTYYIGAIVDPANSQPETNEANNTRATVGTVTVVRNVDLTVSALSSTAEGGSVNAGGPITVNSTVTNAGATATTKSNIPVYFYLSKDKVITPADTLLGSRTVSGLAAGAGSGAATTLAIPRTLAPGTYYIGAIVDPNNTQPETNEANNTRVTSGAVTVVRNVDLTVSALSSTAEGGSVNAGGSVTLNSAVVNAGTTAGWVAFPVYFYLSKDKVITPTDTVIGWRTVPGLAAGAGSGAATTLTIPRTLAPGTYYIGAIVDPANSQPETNKANNARTTVGTVTVVRNVDLTVSALSSTAEGGSVNAGGSVNLNSTVTNAGTTAGWVAFPVYYYLSTDKVITSADKLIGSRTVPGLAAGASNSAVTTLTVPRTLVPGTYYIGAIVDPANSQPETNEANNTRATTGTVTVH